METTRQPITFRRWLLLYRESDTAIGDLARDLALDTRFRGETSWALRRRMEKLDACNAALFTLEDAEALYEQYVETL